ncbi:MAG: NUDIX hydrolase [Rhodocyclaceae bacterium]|nr:NUDIX hydrolase [Rhodocyclaceae bacterium]
MDRIWKPNVTVAALMERDGRFLLVEEETDDGLRFNQPAGHLDEDESLVEACSREALEETAYAFTPTALVGIYQWPRPQGDITYLRFAFAGIVGAGPSQADAPPVGGSEPGLRAWGANNVGARETARQLDAGILRAVWLTPAEIEACADRHRSPLVLQCVRDYLAGRRFPLDVIRHHG